VRISQATIPIAKTSNIGVATPDDKYSGDM
jgi:hypothetical protein